MTIIWIGTDDVDFSLLPYTSSTSGYYRSIFSRASYSPNERQFKFLRSSKFSPITSGWFSFILTLYSSGAYFETLNTPIFSFFDSASANRIGVGTGSAISKMALLKRSAEVNTVLIEESGNSFQGGLLNFNNKFDIQLINYGETGTINFFLNGRLILTYTGDIRLSGISGFDTVAIGPYSETLLYGTRFSELIVADEDTRKFYIKTLAPNAAGDVNEWSGAYTDIDETLVSTTDKITANADDLLFLTNMTGMPSLNRSYKVKAVKVAAQLDPAYSDLGAKIGIKTNSAVHLGNVEEHGGRITIEKIYHNNPETGIAFTPAEVDALQLALYSTTLDEYEY